MNGSYLVASWANKGSAPNNFAGNNLFSDACITKIDKFQDLNFNLCIQTEIWAFFGPLRKNEILSIYFTKIMQGAKKNLPQF